MIKIFDFTNKKSPKMPNLGKGTECIKLLLTQVSKDMHEPIVPMLFPILAAHVSDITFIYPDNSTKELCGMMANLVADSGCNKGQLAPIIEAICREFRAHDAEEMEKLVKWQKDMATKPTNMKKPVRPDLAFWFPPSNTTNPAFIQNAMNLEKSGGHTQYFNLPEVEMANSMCGNRHQMSHTLRNIYDVQRCGALRATADGVTGNPVVRANFTISSTPYSTRKFYKGELQTGTMGRMVFSYKCRTERSGKIPRQGKYTSEFLEKLDVYLGRLGRTKGSNLIIKPLNKLVEKIAADMCDIADLADDDIIWDLSKRAIVSAWKAGCVLWIMNEQTWSRSIGELVEWLAYHDIWSKVQIFGGLLSKNTDNADEAQRRGPQILLAKLPDTFSEADLEKLRSEYGKSKEGTNAQLRKWKFRKLITESDETGLYTKTAEFLSGTYSTDKL